MTGIGYGKKALQPDLWFCPSIFLDWLKKNLSGQPISESRFEPGSSQIRTYNANESTATLAILRVTIAVCWLWPMRTALYKNKHQQCKKLFQETLVIRMRGAKGKLKHVHSGAA
jgi:hypothetical protein